ncbi:unnamed protein product [Amoebophrya sp. A25]|nr:unnamed protein product [Amoebophrya sp. A25]|eukprot:GSA25T00022744001.1
MTGPVTVCTSCNEQVPAECQREHYRCERHMYNVKRKLEGAAPIPADVWERKLARFREIQAETAKKTDHLKHDRKANKSDAGSVKSGGKAAINGHADASTSEVPLPQRCLFDRRTFTSLDDNLQYMMRHYSFFLPDRDYCVDKEGLLTFLHKKIAEGHQCIYCDRTFKSEADVRQHMLDKNHTRIGLEGRTRTGNYSEELTNELKAQLEEFYDYSSSWSELNLKSRKQKDNLMAALADSMETRKEAARKEAEMTDAEKLADMFDFFDEDEDDLLNFEEAVDFFEFVSGDDASAAPLTREEYDALAGVEGVAGGSTSTTPTADRNSQEQEQEDDDGDVDTTGNSKKEGLDLDAVAKLVIERQQRTTRANTASTISGTGASSSSSSSTSNNSTRNDTSSLSAISAIYARFEAEYELAEEDEVHVCDDEEEFQRICKALDLKVAKILPTGNLRLPDGSEAAHRSLRYIYRQRGLHIRSAASASAAKAQKAIGGGFFARLALQNGAQHMQIGISQLKKQGRQVMAIKREDQKRFMKQGIKDTIINRKRTIRAMDYVR